MMIVKIIINYQKSRGCPECLSLQSNNQQVSVLEAGFQEPKKKILKSNMFVDLAESTEHLCVKFGQYRAKNMETHIIYVD